MVRMVNVQLYCFQSRNTWQHPISCQSDTISLDPTIAHHHNFIWCPADMLLNVDAISQMGLFSLGAVQSLAAALSPLCAQLLPDQTLQPPIGPVPAHAVLSLALSTCVVAVWLFFRASPWAWVLQDVLGISLIVLVLRQFRLPDHKVSKVSVVFSHTSTAVWCANLGTKLLYCKRVIVVTTFDCLTSESTISVGLS